MPESKEEINVTTSAYTGELRKQLEGYLEVIVKSVGAIAAYVRVLSSDSKELHLVGAVGQSSADAIYHTLNADISCKVCGNAVSSNSLQVADASLCRECPVCRLFSDGCTHVVAVPLAQYGEPMGVLALFFNDPNRVSTDSLPLIGTLADFVGITLGNIRQNMENRRINLMAERQYMANEIHDSLAPTLVFARMRLSLLLQAVQKQDQYLAMTCVNDVDDALETSQKTVRELITYFRYQMDPKGLEYALQRLVHDFRKHTGIALGYKNRVTGFDLPLEYETQIFQIVSEALANIAKHSGATHASLLADHENGRFLFTVEDNGHGGCAPIEGHYGMMIMRERALHIKGELDVISTNGAGTRVRFDFPDPETTTGQHL